MFNDSDVQQALLNKQSGIDAGVIVGGGIYSALSAHLPLAIGIATFILFLWRIYVTVQESRINKLKRAILEKELNE